METLATVDVKDGLTEGEFLEAVGCAMNPMEFFFFKSLFTQSHKEADR